MRIIHTVSALRQQIVEARNNGKKIGVVPTMGALHAGHIQLVKQSVNENDLTVVSIFVNPTQFNDPSDLDKYPRTLDTDCEKLTDVGCNLVFAPSVSEIYPTEETPIFDFGTLGEVMEGAFRPGHFNGVAQVVTRLFDLIEPHRAYFGLKDFQQLAIIRHTVKKLAIPVEIIACPIVRHSDGLAMSSRNALLTPEQRKIAPRIAEILSKSITFVAESSPKEAVAYIKQAIEAVPLFKLEYIDIVDGDTLQPVSSWQESNHIVGCIAVYCGHVRLIDNIVYRH